MREIKFRFWDTQDKKFAENVAILNDGTILEIDVTPFSPNQDKYVAQQYTGLKDKNGVEIYEGDIFKDDFWWVGEGTVEYANGMFGFEGGEEDTPDFRPIIECEHIEVIGNIFEGVDK